MIFDGTAIAGAMTDMAAIADAVRTAPNDLSMAREYVSAELRYEYELHKAAIQLAADRARARGDSMSASLLDEVYQKVVTDGLYIAIPKVSSASPGFSGLDFGAAGTDALLVNESLAINQRITSQGGAYYAVLQGDGNFVVYRTSDGRSLWASGTYGKSTSPIFLQGDGNLVIYTSDHRVALWSSGTYGRTSNPVLLMQSDGNLVLYDGPPSWGGYQWTGKAIWSSGTQQGWDGSTTGAPTGKPGGGLYYVQPAQMPSQLIAQLQGLTPEQVIDKLVSIYEGQPRSAIPLDAYAVLSAWASAVHKNQLFGERFLIPNWPGRSPQVAEGNCAQQWLIRRDNSSFLLDYHNLMADFTRFDITLNCITAAQGKDWGTFGIEGFHIENVVAKLASVAGSIIGSIIPGVGTAIGAAVGGVIGSVVQSKVGVNPNVARTDQGSIVAVTQAVGAAISSTPAPSSTQAQVAQTEAAVAQATPIAQSLQTQVDGSLDEVKTKMTGVSSSKSTTLYLGLGLATLFVLGNRKTR